LLWIILTSFHSTMFEHVDIILNYTWQNAELTCISLASLEEFTSHGTIYHLMFSTLSAWTHSSVNWLMFILYTKVCKLFVFVSVFWGTCVLESINFFFFFVTFLAIVSANEMYSQWLVPVLFVFYAYCKSIIY